MADRGPQDLRATVDSAFEAVVKDVLTAQGFRASRRAVTRRDGDLYFSLRLRAKPNQPWGSYIFSLAGGLALRQCLPFTPRPSIPYDYSQLTIPWQTMNYGFEPEGASGGRGTITTELVLADTLMTERDAFITDIVTSFQSTADVREHLWHAFSTESFHQFGTAQSVYQWRYLAVLLAADGRTSELAQVEARMPNLSAAGVPASVQQDWDSVWQQAGLSRDS